MTIPIFAGETKPIKADYSIVHPMFVYINIFQNTFDLSTSGKASVTVYLNARDVDEVRISAELQQYKNGTWTTIRSWSNTSSGTSCGLGEAWYVASGYSYRMVSYGYTYKASQLVESTYYTSEIKPY